MWVRFFFTRWGGAWQLLRMLLGDARHYQIASLAGLLAFGWSALGFRLSWEQVVVTLGAALLTQFVGWRVKEGNWKAEWRSALITGLSLCLLCRANASAWAALAAMLGVGSKFVLCWRGKHWFNPANFGLMVAVMVSSGEVWVSGGQWGSAVFWGFLFACLGGLVVTRARRADVALTFLGTWAMLLVGRSLWLGEPMTIPLHRLQNGGLLLFAFFMISDPRSTPDSRTGRVVFAVLVALAGWWWQFLNFGTNGALWALLVLAPLTLVLDRVLPGGRFEWRPSNGTKLNGASREPGGAAVALS